MHISQTLRGFFCLITIASAALPPGSGVAGPWVREAGHTFISYSLLTDSPDPMGSDKSYLSFYGEHGIGQDLTLGLISGTNAAGDYKVIAFTRFAPLRKPRTPLIAFDAAFGLYENDLVIAPGLSIGSNVDVGGSGGWWSLDSRAMIRSDARFDDFDSDLTLGVKTTERLSLITQLQASLSHSGHVLLRWENLVAYEIIEGHLIQIGVNAGVARSHGFGLKLGMWHNFAKPKPR